MTVVSFEQPGPDILFIGSDILFGNRDFLRAYLGLVSAPVFSQIETEIPKFYNKIITNFPMSDFVLHFCENFMKIAPKITKLQLIIFKFVVEFEEYS